jgi:hypothetical protein
MAFGGARISYDHGRDRRFAFVPGLDSNAAGPRIIQIKRPLHPGDADTDSSRDRSPGIQPKASFRRNASRLKRRSISMSDLTDSQPQRANDTGN